MKHAFERTLETWWGVFPEALCRDLQQRAFGGPVVGHRRPLEDAPATHSGRRVDRQATQTNPSSSYLQEHMHSSAPSNYHHNHHGHHPHSVVPPTASFITPSPGLPSNILRILQDLRVAVAVAPEKYNEKYVAEIMYHVSDFFVLVLPNFLFS